jgi:hypothetical protein
MHRRAIGPSHRSPRPPRHSVARRVRYDGRKRMDRKCFKLALSVTLATMAGAPAMAKVTFPVTVPQECVELAQREGVSVVINSKYEATKAKFKLARLRDRDPMVHECRAAVERARRAAVQ